MSSTQPDMTQQVPIADTVVRYRRIVTGNAADGKSVILSDEICQNIKAIMGVGTFATTELWKVDETPVNFTKEADDPAAESVSVAPPLNGNVFRIVEYPPDREWQKSASFDVMTHATPSIDYAFVIDGEIYAIVDKGETLMKSGDVLIQRGTSHAWSNRSDKPCRVLFAMIGAIGS